MYFDCYVSTLISNAVSATLSIVIVRLSATYLGHTNFMSTDFWVQVLYSITDQSMSGSAGQMTRSANHHRHSVVD